MADVFVDHTATGAGDGTTFDDAWTTIDAALNDTTVTVAGSTVYVDDGHVEPDATKLFNNAGTAAGPIKIVSVDKATASNTATNGGSADATYSIGATIALGGVNDITFAGAVQWYGFAAMTSNDNLTFATDCQQEFYDVTEFGLTGTSSSDALAATSDDCYIKFNNVGFRFGNAAHGWNCGGGCRMVLENCRATGTGVASNYFIRFVGPQGLQLEFDGLDLSGLAINGDFIGSGGLPTAPGDGVASTFRGSRLKLPTGGSVNAATFATLGTVIDINNVAIGDAQYDFYYQDYYGTAVADTANYRSATYDGTNGFSAKITTSANAVTGWHAFGFPLCNLRAAANPTLTVELIHEAVGAGTAGDLQDDEFWVDFVAPKVSDGSAVVRTSTRAAPNEQSPTDLTNSVESWTETLTGEVKQAISQTLSGGQAGEHEVWVYVAAPSVDVYVDLQVDGGL